MAHTLALVFVLVVHTPHPADDAPPPGVRALAFSSDGRFLAATTGEPNESGTLTVWETATWRTRFTHVEKTGIPSVSFSPDGQTLAIGVYEQPAKVIDATTGQARLAVRDSKQLRLGVRDAIAVRAITFSPDGRTLATGGIDGKVRIWDGATGEARLTLGDHSDRVYTVAFSAVGKHLASAGGKELRLWDAATGKELWTRNHGVSLVRCAIFSLDGRWVISGGWDGTLRVWNTKSGELSTMFRNLGGVDSVAFAPASRTLAVCSGSKNVYLIDLSFDEPSAHELERVRALIARLDDDSYEVREATSKDLLALGFIAEPELRKAMTESKSVEVRIRARRLRVELSSQKKAELKGHTGRLECVAFSPDGKLLASGGKDGAVRIWGVATRKEVTCLVPSTATALAP